MYMEWVTGQISCLNLTTNSDIVTLGNGMRNQVKMSCENRTKCMLGRNFTQGPFLKFFCQDKFSLCRLFDTKSASDGVRTSFVSRGGHELSKKPIFS